MIKPIDCSRDDRTLLEYVNQSVIRSGITNLVINYFFFSDLDDPDAEPSEHFWSCGTVRGNDASARFYLPVSHECRSPACRD